MESIRDDFHEISTIAGHGAKDYDYSARTAQFMTISEEATLPEIHLMSKV